MWSTEESNNDKRARQNETVNRLSNFTSKQISQSINKIAGDDLVSASLFFPSLRSGRPCRFNYVAKEDQYYGKNGPNVVYTSIRGDGFMQA